MLYAHKDAIFDAEAQTDAPWARPHPVQQFVIGSLNPQPTEPTPQLRFRWRKAAHVGDEMRRPIPNSLDWNAVHERLEQLLPHGLDEATWEQLRQHL